VVNVENNFLVDAVCRL